MGPYKEDVAAIARAACLAHQRGASAYWRNGIKFDLLTAGWCARFVRQCYAAAMREYVPDFDPYGFAWLRRYATEVCRALEDAGYRTNHPEAGDIVGMSPGYRLPGHIGVHLGSHVAENTSSTTRGPGTVLSPISAVQHIITGYYSVYPSRTGDREDEDLKVVGLDNHVIPCRPGALSGVTRADVRPLVEALGFECHYRVWEDGRRRIYIKRPAARG
jgi:hypothetical protein